MPANNKKKKSWDDLFMEVENDPRFQKAIVSMREKFPAIKLTDQQTVRPHKENEPDLLHVRADVPDMLPDCQTVGLSDSPIRVSLTVIQSRVYAALLNGSGQTSYRNIAASAGVTVSVARDAVSRLVKKGVVQKIATVRNATFQGFSYTLLFGRKPYRE